MLQELAVAGEVGDVEVEGDAALLGALEVAGAAQLEVGFGYLEAIASAGHDVEAFAALLAELVAGDEQAVRLVGTATHTSAQLVQLREAEAFGVLDDHDAGVGDVDADLDDGGGDHDLRLAVEEALHLAILVGSLHAAVDHAHLVFGKVLADGLIALLQCQQVEFLVLLYEGVDDVYLSALAQLTVHEGVERGALVVVAVLGLDGLAAGG